LTTIDFLSAEIVTSLLPVAGMAKIIGETTVNSSGRVSVLAATALGAPVQNWMTLAAG